LGLPVVTPGQRLSQVRNTVTSLRELDGPDLYTPVVMTVRGPKAQALAADLADTVTFAAWPGDSRAEMMRLAAGLRALAVRRRQPRGCRRHRPLARRLPMGATDLLS
jgi:alkanesulfonate monooxygenase SsuD/methylene tetrahydromethanopterin reductase-like flavin-dependent oxidoreductase (luciferase family)